jgi:WD40 repeat protein
MVEKKRLTGHSNVVACLVYSKRHNWFASGSRDNTIRCWREIDNNWISASPGKSHTNYIYCLLLNKNEDQLISCS